VDWRKACKRAIANGVIVNTIHCGSHEEGVQGHWKEGAMLADGHYMIIDQNQAVVHIDAPQDAEIARLGGELNSTYVPYGAAGEASYHRQAAQDANAAAMSSSTVAQRAMFKSKAQYTNADWDLVDAVKDKSVDLAKVEAEALPEEMRKMDGDERKEYVEKKVKERNELQGKIKKLSAEREKYVAEKTRELEKSGADTLDGAMLKAIREQATKADYLFE
jgi:hypothetical protein